MYSRGGGLDQRFSTVGLWAGLALASACALLAGNAGASTPIQTTDAGIVGASMQAAPAGVVNSWNDTEMRGATPARTPSPPTTAFDVKPLGGGTASAAGVFLPQDTTAFPLRVHGRIFFRIGTVEYVCSGTVISSRGRNVVLTAGHCVYDFEQSEFASEMVFVPGYDGTAEQPAPFGTWAAAAVFTQTAFRDEGSLSHDIGAVVLSKPVENRVGSRGVAFDLNPDGRSFTIFGYPVEPNSQFTGESLVGCRSSTRGRDTVGSAPSPIAAGPCTMQDGSSGGGWVTDGRYVNSVVSYTYCDSTPTACGIIFGPYFGDQAKSLYTYPAVGGSVKPVIRITSGPPPKIRQSSARFDFAGSGSTPLTYRCRLDSSPFRNCSSRVIAKRLSVGRHILQVRAVDQTGNASRKTVERVFTVLRRR